MSDFTTKALSCAETFNDRTNYISVRNASAWTILDIMVRCIDNGGAPIGFVQDTGFMVLAGTILPGQHVSIDPCATGGGSKPCQATRIEYAFRLRHPTSGQVVPVSGFADDGDNTTYYPSMEFTQPAFMGEFKSDEGMQFSVKRVKITESN
jgi:hypothetical protein